MQFQVVSSELQKFAARQVVVTDRLHGLIFALITHTPCVVMSAFNHKIREFCAMLGETNAVRFIDRNIDRLDDAVAEMLCVGRPAYPDFEKAFSETADFVRADVSARGIA